MTPLFIFGTEINENYPNFVPKINKGVFVFLPQNFVERCIRGLRMATEFVQRVNHYRFIYINYFYMFRR